MGGSGKTLGHDLLAFTYCLTFIGLLVGVHDFRLGRILGLGPSGKFSFDALACNDCFCSFNNGTEAQGHVPNVEHAPNNHEFCNGSVGNVY